MFMLQPAGVLGDTVIGTDFVMWPVVRRGPLWILVAA